MHRIVNGRRVEITGQKKQDIESDWRDNAAARVPTPPAREAVIRRAILDKGLLTQSELDAAERLLS